MIESMFVGRRNPSAGAAVNNLVPQLGGLTTPPTSSTPPSRDDVPSLDSATSNFELCTSATRRIVFVVVETHVGHGADVARSPEFGGPVTATPSFAFFARGAKVGECKGADRRELEAQVGMLALAAFPPHPHDKVAVPALDKLARQLAPVTSASWPPMPALKKKLDEALGEGGAGVSAQDKEVLGKRVPAYLAALPAPPAPAPRLSAPLPPGLLDAWLPATLAFLSSPTSPPSTKFPILDLVRLALSRDPVRLAAQPALIAFLPDLLALLAAELAEHEHAPDSSAERPPGEGAGAAWSVVARVYAARVEGEAVGADGAAGGDEWEAELASALLEALTLEEDSVEVGASLLSSAFSISQQDIEHPSLTPLSLLLLFASSSSSPAVHRLAATLGLLLYRSPYSADLCALLDVLDARSALDAKDDLAGKLSSGGEAGEVRAVLKDVRALLAAA